MGCAIIDEDWPAVRERLRARLATPAPEAKGDAT